MSNQVSVSIDVEDMDTAVTFYTQALGCEFKKQYKDTWHVVTRGNLDIHIQSIAAGTVAAADAKRHYDRHWTPVHLDFGVTDIRTACSAIEAHGGTVESQTFGTHADIAVCADPFGNGFCVIRE